jgi:hypothetical protein
MIRIVKGIQNQINPMAAPVSIDADGTGPMGLAGFTTASLGAGGGAGVAVSTEVSATMP